MYDVIAAMDAWRKAGRKVAFAAVLETWGSSPRPVGSLMAIRDDGLIVGSVSGGCIEGAVTQAALRAFDSPTFLDLRYGPVGEEELFALGLLCGGSIRVGVWTGIYDDLEFLAFVDSILRRKPSGLLLSLSRSVVLGGSSLMEVACALQARQSRCVEVEGEPAFALVQPRLETLLLIGAPHLAMPLIRMAKPLGFEVVVIEPRVKLAQPERFEVPPDRLINLPIEAALHQVELHEATYAVALTHDAKLDDPALLALLRSPARYVGALGGRNTQAKRREWLAKAGLKEAEIARLHGPVGLSIGAETADEIAVSILAEIIQARRCGSS